MATNGGIGGALGRYALGQSSLGLRKGGRPQVKRIETITSASSGTVSTPSDFPAWCEAFAWGAGGSNAGGGGAFVYARFPVGPGQTVAYTVGAASLAGNADGAASTVTYNGRVLSAGGGGGFGSGGIGGTPLGGDLGRRGGVGGAAAQAGEQGGASGGAAGGGGAGGINDRAFGSLFAAGVGGANGGGAGTAPGGGGGGSSGVGAVGKVILVFTRITGS